MGTIVILALILALLVGGVGLLVEGLLWLLAIAAIIIVAGFVLDAVLSDRHR